MNEEERMKIIKNCKRWVNCFTDDDGSTVAYSSKKRIAVMQKKFDGWWEIVKESENKERYNEIVEYCKTFN